MAAKTERLFLRLDSEMNRWIDANRGTRETRAGFVRRILAQEMRRSREEELLAMFNRAARDLTPEDRRDRELVTKAFEDRD